MCVALNKTETEEILVLRPSSVVVKRREEWCTAQRGETVTTGVKGQGREGEREEVTRARLRGRREGREVRRKEESKERRSEEDNSTRAGEVLEN